MKNNYSVLIVAYASVVVMQADSEEDAMNIACEMTQFGDLEMDEAKVEAVIEDDHELKTHRRHAQKIVEAE